jgi:hypothetical protein
LVRGAGLDARTTQSPTNRGASPWAALARPAHDDTNAYYAAEVQSVLRPEIRSHVLCKPGRIHNRRAFQPTLNFWPRTHRFARDAISIDDLFLAKAEELSLFSPAGRQPRRQTHQRRGDRRPAQANFDPIGRSVTRSTISRTEVFQLDGRRG